MKIWTWTGTGTGIKVDLVSCATRMTPDSIYALFLRLIFWNKFQKWGVRNEWSASQNKFNPQKRGVQKLKVEIYSPLNAESMLAKEIIQVCSLADTFVAALGISSCWASGVWRK